MMTKKEALQITVELWSWIAKEKKNRPGRLVYKHNWPMWQKGFRPRIYSDCACCAYVEQRRETNCDFDCNQCPMMGYWGPIKGRPKDIFNCLQQESPYYKWLATNSAEDAQAVADLALKALKELEEV